MISICFHLRYTATNCGKQRVALHRRLTVLANLTIPLQCPNFSIKYDGFEYNELSWNSKGTGLQKYIGRT